MSKEQRMRRASEPKGEPVFVALGSNLGDRRAHIAAALVTLRAEPRIDVVAVSRLYETKPLGPPAQEPYLNAVAQLAVELEPRGLLERLLAIESRAGRRRGPQQNIPRTLDLDLLFFGDRCISEPGLVVPHPRLHERAFVLEPLCDVAPDLVHPRLGERIADLARRVRDPEAVRCLANQE